MAKLKHDGCIILSADKEHPISSKLCPDGRLNQMGISGEGFQREVGVHRHTEKQNGGNKFCWTLSLYQHPGIRHEIPLGCSILLRSAPKKAKQFARAFHKIAEMGHDPREVPDPWKDMSVLMARPSLGVPRGKLWHQIMLPALCAKDDEKQLTRVLKNHGVWPKELPDDITEGLGRARLRRKRSKKRTNSR